MVARVRVRVTESRVRKRGRERELHFSFLPSTKINTQANEGMNDEWLTSTKANGITSVHLHVRQPNANRTAQLQSTPHGKWKNNTDEGKIAATKLKETAMNWWNNENCCMRMYVRQCAPHRHSQYLHSVRSYRTECPRYCNVLWFSRASEH